MQAGRLGPRRGRAGLLRLSPSPTGGLISVDAFGSRSFILPGSVLLSNRYPSPMTFKKVLILSASAGAGHMRAAEAVERAFRLTGAAAEVRHVDTLHYTNKLFRHLYSKAYIEMVNKTPELLGWLYDHLDKPWKHERRRLAFDKLNTRPFVKLLEAYRPEITVCTHFLPAEIISWLKAKERVAIRAGDRRHRLRRARDVALPPLRALLRRDRRDARAPGEARHSRGEDHDLPASRSTRSSPSRRTSSRCARSTACGPT